MSFKECDSPTSLYSTCLSFICSNLDQVCELKQIEFSTGTSLPIGVITKTNQLSYDQHQQLLANLKSGNATQQLLSVYAFRDKRVKFNHIVCEDLLERLGDLNKLNDTTLALFLNPSQVFLRRFVLKNCNVSRQVLKKVLKEHQIDELSLINVQLSSTSGASGCHPSTENQPSLHNCGSCTFSISNLVDSLNPCSLEHLRYLNVSRNTSLFGSILVSIKEMSNLQKLNVSFTSFNNQTLDIVTRDLAHLEYLDVSGTKCNDLSLLLRIKDTLKYLCMYNMRASLNDEIIPVLCSLTALKHLDVSCDVSTKIFADMSLSVFDVNLLLDELASSNLHGLSYLDISGKSSIKQESLVFFLRSYPELKFLGLALTNASSFDILTQDAQTKTISSLRMSVSTPVLSSIANDSKNHSDYRAQFQFQNRSFSPNRDLVVTGESTEAQVIASLRQYKARHIYIQKALSSLYSMTTSRSQTRVDLLQLILELMHIHSKSQSVQLAATTCVYNLTKQNLYALIPSSVLSQVINTITTTMLNYPCTVNLQRNCLLILCNQQILNNCAFNKYDCIKAALDCLITYNNVTIIANSSIAICAQVLLNSENKNKRKFRKLSNPKYMQKLIELVEPAIQLGNADQLLYSVLDIIWCLSEENIEWCGCFLGQNGLNVYLKMMKVFEHDSNVLVKALGTMFNLSEIDQIKHVVFCHPIVQSVEKYINHSELRVSFLASGFMVNYTRSSFVNARKATVHNGSELSDLKERLADKIESWSQKPPSQIEMKRQSITSIIRMLKNSSSPLSQIWAVWFVFYYATQFHEYSNKYENESPFMLTERIRAIMLDKKTEYNVRKQFALVFQLIHNAELLNRPKFS